MSPCLKDRSSRVQLNHLWVSSLACFIGRPIYREGEVFQLIISFFRKLMQKLGKEQQEDPKKRSETNSTSRQEKPSRSYPEDQQMPCSKSKKITKIIHNTVIFYVDEKGQTKTMFYQKLRDRKSRENKTNEQKIRRQAQEYNRKIKIEAQATCKTQPQLQKQQQPPTNGLNWVPNYYWSLPFMGYPAFSPVS